MSKVAKIYRGWIGAKEIDRIELEAMGVQISGSWNPAGTFDYCSMSDDVFRIFSKRWKGRYVWGLIGRMEVMWEAPVGDATDEDIPF